MKEEDEKWFEMQDLNVAEIEKSLVGLGESYVQVRGILSLFAVQEFCDTHDFSRTFFSFTDLGEKKARRQT